MLPSKKVPITSALASSIGEPELPPMMSSVVETLKIVAGSSLARAAIQRGSRS